MSTEFDHIAGSEPQAPSHADVAGARVGAATLEPVSAAGPAHDEGGHSVQDALAGGLSRSGPDMSQRMADTPAGCTAAQLRRFIKSRAYVPMHELRRRFELTGEADDVSLVGTPSGVVYLGLPGREAQLVGELVRQGDVGLELCRDPRVPIVVGVYPMRPITRQ